MKNNTLRCLRINRSVVVKNERRRNVKLVRQSNLAVKAYAFDRIRTIIDEYEIPKQVMLEIPTDGPDENKSEFDDSSKIEIRLVQPYTIAITAYENREEGIARLMMYIEGENADGQIYPPTQPLTMRYALDARTDEIVGKTMELYLGATVGTEENKASATNERSKSVMTRVAGGELVAVMKLVGMATEDACRERRAKIVRAVEKTGKFTCDVSSFRVSTFGPMYSLRPRDNEVSVRIVPKSK
jgi:hypothetical protein